MAEITLLPLIQEAVKAAMRNRDKEIVTTLRMAISELKKEEIDNKVTLDDTFVISILQRMIKQRKDAASQFQEANRHELAEKERNEIVMLSEFLPEQLSNDDLLQIVKAEIISSEAGSMKDIGKVMGSLKPKLLGKADMSTVSRLVKEQLSQ
ncbi:GatB/YqeY domain-containing protein [Gammaproteobacteria bacterium]|nr:GatB/YqeY domain-containing protein [Gammaproteobacteria bacterium]